MPILHVSQKVEDYDKWKAEFHSEQAKSMRSSAGATGMEHVMRNSEDPNNVIVVVGWDSLDNARKFTKSPELREGMKNAGVQGPPTIMFLEEG